MLIHVVDGTFELFRCAFGAPSRVRADGMEVGAARALAGTLLALLAEPDVTHVGVAFDTVIESFRNDLFAGYKTGEGLDPPLLAQFPLAERVSRALGLVTWSMIEFECDDALATMAARADADAGVSQVVICSPDKDLAQCVRGTRVVTRDRIRKTTLDDDGVRAKFGVPPAAIADLLALTGDDADGVPGLPGFGGKTAAALLVRYGCLEAIPVDVWDLKLRGADKLLDTWRAQRDDALLYKKLTTLRRDVPLPETPAALAWRGPDAALLADVSAELTDPGLVSRVDKVWRAARARSTAAGA